jgi:SAM-dependent methyltransferase
MNEELLRIDSEEWGPIRVSAVDLEALAEFTTKSFEDAVAALGASRLADMASDWLERDPRTASEIREFYSGTDGYLWELLAWNGSDAYRPYIDRLRRLAELFPPKRYPRALDYGSGVGTAALTLAGLGFDVTIADIAGRTLDYAKKRLNCHGVDFDVIAISEDVPSLPPQKWDLLVCFDVLEHLYYPKEVTRSLMRALKPGGGAAIIAAFDSLDPEHPHHLGDRSIDLREHRFQLYLRRLGVRSLGDGLYQRTGGVTRAALIASYFLWRRTGIVATRLPR